MPKLLSLPSIAGSILLLFCFVFCPQGRAQTPAPCECDITGLSDNTVRACPDSLDTVGITTLSPLKVTPDPASPNALYCPSSQANPDPATYWGVRLSKGNAYAPIDVWGTCRWLDNPGFGSGANVYWVPFKTSPEWHAFLNSISHQPGLTSPPVHCGEPAAETGAPASFSTNPSSPVCTSQLIAASQPCNPAPANVLAYYANAGCTGVTVNDGTTGTPYVYGRTGTSIWPDAAVTQSFNCNNSTTTVTGKFQFLAADADRPDPIMHLSWTPLFNYSPNLILTANNQTPSITVAVGSDVTLNWNTTPTAASCTASCVIGTTCISGWAGTTFSGGSGSFPFTAEAAGTYQITCVASNNLTSTATVGVNIIQPAVCGADNGKTLTEQPINLCSSNETSSTPVFANNTWSWTCTETSNGASSTANCAATLEGASCGSASGTTVASVPTSGLCNVGTASAVSGSGPWAWTCTDDNGGSIANCSANSSAQSCSLNVTSYLQTTVPNNITGPINYTIYGGGGGGGWCSTQTGAGGATLQGSFTVSPGDQITIYPGGGGGSVGNVNSFCGTSGYGAGGGGGGSGYYGGGGGGNGGGGGGGGGSTALFDNGTLIGIANGGNGANGNTDYNVTGGGGGSTTGGSGGHGYNASGASGSLGAGGNGADYRGAGRNGQGGTGATSGQNGCFMCVGGGGGASGGGGGYGFQGGIPVDATASNSNPGSYGAGGPPGVGGNGGSAVLIYQATTCSLGVPTNGACGSANGTAVASAPTTNLCTDGSTPTVTTTTCTSTQTPPCQNPGGQTYTWTCAGTNDGTSASCSATFTPAPVNGQCGAAENTTLSSPPASGLCSTGTASTLSGSGPWTWTCAGLNGGWTASCSANYQAPLLPGCPSSGYASVGGYNWYIGGTGQSCDQACAPYGNSNFNGIVNYVGSSGTDANCLAVAQALGQSLSSNKVNDLASGQPAQGCSLDTGSLSSVWRVTTPATTPSATPLPGSVRICACNSGCSASPVNGQCGSTDGTVASSAPASSSLCFTGTATNLVDASGNGTGPWTWTCAGSSGGTTASCSAAAAPTCGGQSVGGYCWYLGSAGQSCDTVCGAHDGYNSATETYAGSAGSAANCHSVLSAFSHSQSVVGRGGPYGCVLQGGYPTLFGGLATTSSSAAGGIARACACGGGLAPPPSGQSCSFTSQCAPLQGYTVSCTNGFCAYQ